MIKFFYWCMAIDLRLVAESVADQKAKEGYDGVAVYSDGRIGFAKAPQA